MVKNREISGTEELGLVTPTPDEYLGILFATTAGNTSSKHEKLTEPKTHNLEYRCLKWNCILDMSVYHSAIHMMESWIRCPK